MSPGSVQYGASALIGARRSAGLTQEQLAERSGVSVRMLRALEGGHTRFPRPSSLAALAAALGLDEPQQADFLQVRSARGQVDFAQLMKLGRAESMLGAVRDVAHLRLRDLAVVERVEIGPDAMLERNSNFVVLQASADGVDNWVVVFDCVLGHAPSGVRLAPTGGCRVRSATTFPDLRLAVFDLGFDRTLQRGDTHILSFDLDLTDAGRPGVQQAFEWSHGFRQQVRLYTLQVQFRDSGPPRLAWNLLPGPHGEVRRTPLPVLPTGLEIVRPDAAPGRHGVVWQW